LFRRIPQDRTAFIKLLPQSSRQITTFRNARTGVFFMLAAASQLLPAAARFTRQIIPPVIATLIAAGLISAYNRAFSGHLQQPRMAALHHDAAETQADVVTVGGTRPLAAAEAVAIYDNIAPPPRLWEKEARQDAGKDQTIRLAEPAPVPVRIAAPRGEPKSEPRAEPRHVAAVELPPPAVRTPEPVVAAAPVVLAVPPSVVSPPTTAPAVVAMPEQRQPVYQPQYAQPPYQQPQYPPPVIMAQPMVTVPDKPRPTEQAQTEPGVPPQGVFGKIVDTLKPSNLFARAREFGDKIEAVGNDILPNVRQQ
jgi:hypothetical protein